MTPKNPNARGLALLAAVLLVGTTAAGCVENMQDLKDAVTGAETLDTSSLDTPADDAQSALPPATVTNVTKAAKPPVARIAVYGEGGALVFKSGFAADETMVPTVLDGGSTVTFSASDSEAVDTRATLAEYAWTVAPLSAGAKTDAHAGHDDGGHAHAVLGLPGDDVGHDHGAGAGAATGAHDMTGVSVQHTFPEEGGVFLVTLTVKDDLGGEDVQAVKVGVNPAKVTKSVTFQGTVQAGHAYTLPGDAGVSTDTSTHVFNVSSAVNDLPAKAVAAKLVLTPTDARAVDLDLAALDPAGEEAGSSASASSSDERLDLADLGAGDWTAVVSANLGAAAEYALLVEVTYQPVHPDVVALFGEGGDGHGGHAH